MRENEYLTYILRLTPGQYKSFRKAAMTLVRAGMSLEDAARLLINTVITAPRRGDS